jgi:uncharacterized protein YfaA (DUF2138 family)
MAAMALIAGGLVFATIGWARFGGQINALGVDLTQPQAYVVTTALSKLPRDLIKAPIAREVLTEDFAFYYEDHEDRLGLNGALKRIAFEHDSHLGDKLIELALDQPAEVAWWADAKGAPRYWLMAMTRGVLARTLQSMASIAAQDRQLSVIDSIRINGTNERVYALTISPRRTLAFVSHGERLVVLSDPGLLFDEQRHADPASRDVIAKLLSGVTETQMVYRRHFGLPDSVSGHTVVADARLLSFGYQHFFPGVKAMRFDFASGGTSMNSLLRVGKAADVSSAAAVHALWSALPDNPAACMLVPADWSVASATVANAPRQPMNDADKAAWKAMMAQLDGPAAVCWYARSQLQTPLLVAQLKAKDTDVHLALDALSRWMSPSTSVKVKVAVRHGAMRWQRDVTAPWGPRGSGETTSYRTTLAKQDRWISFSPDDGLVDLALDTQSRRYPSIGESMPVGTAFMALLAPKQIADLVQREAFLVLPPGQELFRQAAERHLVPRLNALRKLPTARASVSGLPDANGWVSIDWQAASAAVRVSK